MLGGELEMDIFKLKKNNISVLTEIYAGITIFMTVAYILIINPEVLSSAGMDKSAVFTATILASIIGTLCMAFFSNYPFVLVPGMGINIYFAQTVAKEYGWEIALCAVFIEGVIFVLISLINVRENILNIVPKNLKYAVGTGIGLFIAFTGLKNSGIIVVGENFAVSFSGIKDVGSCLTVIGIIIIGVMSYYKVKGSMLWGILIIYAMGIGCELIGWYNVSDKVPSLIPKEIVSFPASVESVSVVKAFEAVKFDGISLFDFFVVIISFLFADLFATVAAFIGFSEKVSITDEKGKVKRLRRALLADAVGTVAGAAVGVSSTTTCVESAAGIVQGGKTGLTSITAAVLFFLALFFSPLLLSIPNFAIAPVLVITGLSMADSVVKIDFSDFTESIPAFLTIITMPFSGSIVNGLILGVLSYVILKVLTGRKKDVNIIMYVVAFVFFIRLFL